MDQFVRDLWQSVVALFVVEDTRTDESLGMVFSHDLDLRNGLAKLAVLKFDLHDPRPHFLVGVGLFVDYMFFHWPIRKLYAETTEANHAQFSSGERLGYFGLEARLRDHAYAGGGRYEDVLILAIERERWASVPRLGSVVP